MLQSFTLNICPITHSLFCNRAHTHTNYMPSPLHTRIRSESFMMVAYCNWDKTSNKLHIRPHGNTTTTDLAENPM